VHAREDRWYFVELEDLFRRQLFGVYRNLQVKAIGGDVGARVSRPDIECVCGHPVTLLLVIT
jgi:hypothetical protein